VRDETPPHSDLTNNLYRDYKDCTLDYGGMFVDRFREPEVFNLKWWAILYFTNFLDLK